MNKETKSLPQAIKTIVDHYGKDVLNDVRLVNIMSDVVTLDDSLAVKNTFREIINIGYGKKILSLVSAKGDIKMKVRVYAKGIADTKGYNEVIVQYVLYSLLYGVGLCQEPYLRNSEKKSTPVNHRTPQTSYKKLSVKDDDRSHFPKIIKGFLAFLIFVGGIYIYLYYNSSADREQFENKVFSGNSFLSSGDYANAVESYKDAYNSYNALNSSSYKEDALEKIDAVADKLIKEGETNNESLMKASQVIDSELQLKLDDKDKERLTTKKNELENVIKERTDNGRNTLIMNLSTNHGKLDEAGIKLLDDLLKLSPNDYWLNFIKKKEQ